MFVLLGEHSPRPGSVLHAHLKLHHWGRMWSRDKIRRSWVGEIHGFDNGAFAAWRKGTPFPEQQYLKRLKDFMAQPKHYCIVAVTPDIVAAGHESLAFSNHWREKLPDRFPWHLAVQDGITPKDVRPHMHRYKGIFLGGSDDFKRRAQEWCEFAHSEGKAFHWGRCYSIRNVEEAHIIQADSIDSTAPVRSFGVGRVAKAKAWLRTARRGPRQEMLWQEVSNPV